MLLPIFKPRPQQGAELCRTLMIIGFAEPMPQAAHWEADCWDSCLTYGPAIRISAVRMVYLVNICQLHQITLVSIKPQGCAHLRSYDIHPGEAPGGKRCTMRGVPQCCIQSEIRLMRKAAGPSYLYLDLSLP